MIVVAGVGGMAGLFFAGRQFPNVGHLLQACALAWFLSVGVLKALWDLRRAS